MMSSSSDPPTAQAQAQSASVRFIVLLKHDVDKSVHLNLLNNRMQGSVGLIREENWDNDFLKGYVISVRKDSREDGDLIRFLFNHNDVALIEEEKFGKFYTQTQDDAAYGLGRICRDTKLPGNPSYDDLDFVYKYDDAAGEGTDVYIIDSGIKIDHTDFGGRAKWGKTVVPPWGEIWPDEDRAGHGTHVAGISGGTRWGVAKKCTLIAVKVADKANDSISSIAFLSAVNWVRQQAAQTGRPSVTNISLGWLPPSEAVDMVVKDLVNSGVHTAVAAGNDDTDASNESPARVKEAVTTAASDINDVRWVYDKPSDDDFQFASNYGPCVDIFAPGAKITSCALQPGNSAYVQKSGTSMAAPCVAGMIAYIISVKGNMPPLVMKDELSKLSVQGVLSVNAPDTVNSLLRNDVK